ncbi:hypothetical protein N9O47_00440 [Candidatus Pelagibacter sp.]|jgi:hypothetical protein|nr:hypothetical protein [Pelagibacterales bacterium SAG-MED27]MDA9199556.1 hypothetical protein [Candidatus Pelagibacter sp.]MDB3997462.1 hypothetical protein [Candidatus Pelagibacter sp.]|tara:strand:- start:53 stop:1444 length:1392 start_codon:yes stop_codon:yes gene_type:complete
MKKILIILISVIFFQNNLLAEDYETQDFSKFNQWLLENNYSQYLRGEGGKFDICTLYKKNSDAWLNEECGNYPEGKMRLMNNLKIETYGGRWAIPSKKDPKNRDTLIYYNYKNLFSHFNGDSNTYQFGRYEAKPSSKIYKFNNNAKENKFVQKEMQKKAILSYLYFQDDQILIDELTPKDRFGDFVKNETKLRSNSVGKSMVSVVLGHAICEGYIESLDSKINDWPMLKNTLYDNQKIIDFLNMNVGDYKYINDGGPVKDYSYDVDTKSIHATINSFFRNSEKAKPKYNYTQFLPNVIFNYVKFKSGNDFQNLLDKAFQKAGIENSVYFNKLKDPTEHGNAHNMFFASRYDYLRIAKSIIEDYQNDTCLGKYYKEIYKQRIEKKNKGTKHEDPPFSPGKSYGGYFHMDYAGLKDKVIFGMSGYGGNTLIMDMENSRIVVLNSIHWSNKKYKYNVKKLLIEPFK